MYKTKYSTVATHWWCECEGGCEDQSEFPIRKKQIQNTVEVYLLYRIHTYHRIIIRIHHHQQQRQQHRQQQRQQQRQQHQQQRQQQRQYYCNHSTPITTTITEVIIQIIPTILSK